MGNKKYKCRYCGRVMDSPSPHNCTSGFRKSRLWFKEIDMEEKKEMVNSPSHYNQGDIECIDGIVGAFGKDEALVFCKINAFKYLWRLGHKDGEAQEIGKIKWYLDKYLELKIPPKINAMTLDGIPVWVQDKEGTPIAKELSKSDLKRLGLTDREAENIINKK